MGFVPVEGWSTVEAGGDVAVAEPDDGVLAGQGGTEQSQVGRIQGAEPGDGAPVVDARPAQGVQRGDAFALKWGRSEGLQIALVGADADLEASPQVADALSHLTPPPLAPALGVGDDAQNPELARIVDDRLDPKHGGLVVDLDPVTGHPVTDPPAFGSTFGVGDDLGRQ